MNKFHPTLMKIHLNIKLLTFFLAVEKCLRLFCLFFSTKTCNSVTRSEYKLIKSENFPTLLISCFKSICDGCMFP